MKNIAIMIPTLSGGGAERIAGLLSIYLSRKYNVYILLERDDNISYNYNGKLLKIPLDETGQVEAVVREYKKKYEIDCTISFLERMDIINIRTKVNDLIIVSERLSNGEMEPYSYGMEKRIRQWYPYADKIVAVSHGVAYDLAHNYGIESKLLTTIYNFIDKEGIARKANQPLDENVESFLGGSKLILNVGRLAPQKNQQKLLRQFAKLVERGYDVKLIIVGTGPLEDQLRQTIDELGLNSRVRLESYGANPFPYYKLAAMMVLSSDYEGLPNVVLEAMTLGLPVVAADCLSGPRELLKNSQDYTRRTSGVEICERGILVEKACSDETGETSYLADGMAILLNDSALRMDISQKCYAYMQDYSNEKIYSQWLDVIENTSREEKKVPPISIPIPEGCKKVIVYGAGQYGKAAMAYLAAHKSEMNLELLCFAVSDGCCEKKSVLGIPVYEITALKEHVNDSIVMVGVSETYEEEVRQILDKFGFRYIYKTF